MGHAASPLPERSPVVLAIVIAVATGLDLTFAYLLHFELLGLLSFGAFCIGYSVFLTSRRNGNTANSEAGVDAVVSKSTSTVAIPQRPAIIREQRVASNGQLGIERRPYHALTIDLEDYFHTEVAAQGVSFENWEQQLPRVEASTHRLLDLLDRSGTRATFFVLGWVAKRYPHLVREIHWRGHELGCHSLNHQLVCRMNPTEFYENTRTAKDLIESVIKDRILGYRAPCFSITPGCEWAFDTLAHLGFAYDSSVHPVHHPVYGNPGAPRAAYRVGQDQLLEFPIATWKVAGRNLPVGGGAYLRLLPYQYIRRGLAAWEKDMKSPAMLYLHPWEIDPFQPYIPLSFQSKIRQTWGTTTMERKLERLLTRFHFAPVREVYKDMLDGKIKVARTASDFQHIAAVAQVAG